MFLLILRRSSGSWPGTCFTFQYVSINTRGNLSSPPRPYHFTFQYVSINTHSLSLAFSSVCSFTFQYVSINTDAEIIQSAAVPDFTFQYVSINTNITKDPMIVFISLHSNMFLLIRVVLDSDCCTIWLYIPICFY